MANPRSARAWRLAAAGASSIAVLAVGAVAADYQATPQPGTARAQNALAGTRWQLVEVIPRDAAIKEVPASSGAQVHFVDSSHAAGSDPVNNWTATYAAANSTVTFHAVQTSGVGSRGPDNPYLLCTNSLLSGQPVAIRRSGVSLMMLTGACALRLQRQR